MSFGDSRFLLTFQNMPATSDFTSCPTKADDLRQLLGIQSGTILKCHGYTKKQPACNNPLSKATSSAISSLLRRIVQTREPESALILLDQLARVVMCRRWHQNLAEKMIADWTARLKEFDGTPNPATCPITKEEKGEPTREPRPKPVSSPPHCQPSPTGGQNTEAPIKTHGFQIYKRPISMLEVNQKIKSNLACDLLKSETPDPGYVYGYTFPPNYDARGIDSSKVVAKYVKIGRSKNLDQRMKKIHNGCGYQPEVLFKLRMPCSQKIERIVHLQLWNERRNENGCPTCGARHMEWFEVNDLVARRIVEMWSAWALTLPYNTAGQLKQHWRDRLENADLADPDCWKRLTRDSSDGEAAVGSTLKIARHTRAVSEDSGYDSTGE